MDLRILQIESTCTGCGACVNICPKHCLELKPNGEGFYYPIYDPLDCIGCGLCEKACHVLAMVPHHSPCPDSFFMYRTNDAKLLESTTSGGAFSLLASWVLEQGGVVFGSRYNGGKERLEVFNTDETSLASLRKSKYIESYMGDSLSKVKDYLKENRRVLFCGTPCQIRGLKQFLRASKCDTALLITVDFACHGVPCNLFFTVFKGLFESRGRKVVDVDFRYKDFSSSTLRWHNSCLKMDFDNGKRKLIRQNEYYYCYYQPFCDNLCLRKSCYSCTCAIQSDADFSIGDFWGIGKYRKELDDNRGMSFVGVNNKLLLPVWKELSLNGFVEKLPYDAIKYQYEDKSAKRTLQLKSRDEFFNSVSEIGFMKAVYNHYGKLNIYIMLMKSFIKKIIGRV